MRRIVVYTAIIGGYDTVPSIAHLSPDISCFVLSDSAIEAPGWQHVRVANYWNDNKLTSGFLKTHPSLLFPDDVICVWIDANLSDVRLDSGDILDAVNRTPIATLPHIERSTVAEEAEAVLDAGLDHEYRVRQQMGYLGARGFPDDAALSATMFLISDLSDHRTRMFYENWWYQILNGSRRDQLSFEAAAWLTSTPRSHLGVDWREANRLFSRHHHDHPNGRQVGPNGENDDLLRSTSFDLAGLPDGYPEPAFCHEEVWDSRTLGVLRRLNSEVVRSGEPMEGNYCYMHQSSISPDSPPDPRRSWKREYLRRCAVGADQILEVGFNAGHSALVMLSSAAGVAVTAIDLGEHEYSLPCAEALSEAFPDRLEVWWGDSRDLLYTRGLTAAAFDLVHIDGGHGQDVFQNDIGWWVSTSRSGSRLLVDDAYVPHIRAVLEELEESGVISPWVPGFIGSGENAAYVRNV